MLIVSFGHLIALVKTTWNKKGSNVNTVLYPGPKLTPPVGFTNMSMITVPSVNSDNKGSLTVMQVKCPGNDDTVTYDTYVTYILYTDTYRPAVIVSVEAIFIEINTEKFLNISLCV